MVTQTNWCTSIIQVNNYRNTFESSLFINGSGFI